MAADIGLQSQLFQFNIALCGNTVGWLRLSMPYVFPHFPCTPGGNRTRIPGWEPHFECGASACSATGMCFRAFAFRNVTALYDIYKKDFNLMPNRDSNPDKRNQNPLRYRYAIGQLLSFINTIQISETETFFGALDTECANEIRFIFFG